MKLTLSGPAMMYLGTVISMHAGIYILPTSVCKNVHSHWGKSMDISNNSVQINLTINQSINLTMSGVNLVRGAVCLFSKEWPLSTSTSVAKTLSAHI